MEISVGSPSLGGPLVLYVDGTAIAKFSDRLANKEAMAIEIKNALMRGGLHVVPEANE